MEICAKAILREDGVPPFHAHACEVLTHTLDPDSCSSQLSRLVLRDLGLTSHILRIANSAMYNHSGRSILSVRHAITLLGWEAVRNLVGAVRYIEHFVSRSPAVRELVLLSALTAAHGKQVAASIGYARPDEAYICGLFRNLGEVLIACYQPAEYSRILLTMHEEQISDRAAAMRVLDFGWDDLGRVVAEAWNMPRKVRMCLGGPEQAAGPADRSLVSIANYGHGLTRSLYRDGARFDQVHLRSVLNENGQTAILPVRDLRNIVDTTVEETRQTFSGLHIPIDELRLESQVAKAREALAHTSLHEPTLNGEVLDRVLHAAKRSVTVGEFELTALIQELLEALCCAGFDGAVFGFVTGDSSRIRGRLGAGVRADELLSAFDFPVAAFPLEDRFDDGTLVVQQFNPGGFVLLPVLVERKLAGCLYADRCSPAAGLGQIRPSLCGARDLIATAIRKRAQTRRPA